MNNSAVPTIHSSSGTGKEVMFTNSLLQLVTRTPVLLVSSLVVVATVLIVLLVRMRRIYLPIARRDKPTKIGSETVELVSLLPSNRPKRRLSATGISSLFEFSKEIADISRIFPSVDSVEQMVAAVPPRFSHSPWKLVYSVAEHGFSLGSFYDRVNDSDATLLVLKDTSGHVFGAFLPERWHVSQQYIGNGETFLFELYPSLQVFPWGRINSFFAVAKRTYIAFGGKASPYILVMGCGKVLASHVLPSIAQGFRHLVVSLYTPLRYGVCRSPHNPLIH